MLAAFEARILALIDDMVEDASDDELFASGYLRGHVTLAVASLEQLDDNAPVAEALQQAVSASLQHAIAAGELSPRDRILVEQMWHQLFLQVHNP